jgi:hypothetical protein
MVDTTSKWEDQLGRWLEPFLVAWVSRLGGGYVRCMLRD